IAPAQSSYVTFIITSSFSRMVDEALYVEGALFLSVTRPKKGLLYRKYGDTLRDGPYRRSSGANKVAPDARLHSVYMNWREKTRNKSGWPADELEVVQGRWA